MITIRSMYMHDAHVFEDTSLIDLSAVSPGQFITFQQVVLQVVFSFKTVFTMRTRKWSFNGVTRYMSAKITGILHNDSTDGTLVFSC